MGNSSSSSSTAKPEKDGGMDPFTVLGPAAGVGGWRGFETMWNGTMCRLDPAAVGWRCCFLRTKAGK